MYGAGTDPIPYITAAYLVGLVFIGGYGALLIFNERKLKLLKKTLEKSDN